ncbi:MAG: hypothetical protein Q7R95_11605 [bacterium]|nr:hypothetical protein [bacterium]
MEEKNIQEDIKILSIARISAFSDDLGIIIGNKKYTKKEILESIKNGDETGQEVIDTQIEYLRDMASGAIYENS